jgi:hypothetical protein
LHAYERRLCELTAERCSRIPFDFGERLSSDDVSVTKIKISPGTPHYSNLHLNEEEKRNYEINEKERKRRKKELVRKSLSFSLLFSSFSFFFVYFVVSLLSRLGRGQSSIYPPKCKTL